MSAKLLVLAGVFAAALFSERSATEQAGLCLGWDSRIAAALPSSFHRQPLMHGNIVVVGGTKVSVSLFGCGSAERVPRVVLSARTTPIAFIEADDHSSGSKRYYTMFGLRKAKDGSYRFLTTESDQPPPGSNEKLIP